jgi:hypothetical protein
VVAAAAAPAWAATVTMRAPEVAAALACEMRLAAQGASAPQLADLLKNETMLDQYNMLFVSCAVGRYAALSPADRRKKRYSSI